MDGCNDATDNDGEEKIKLAQLFQPFNRLGQEPSNVEGTGIGLMVSKRLIEWRGGEIGMQSTVGMGRVLWFELSQAVAPTLARGSLTACVASGAWSAWRCVAYPALCGG